VQHPAARATTSTDLVGYLLVDPEQELVKTGISEEGVTHLFCLSFFLAELKETAPLDNFQVI
jgi:hypothetical protein